MRPNYSEKKERKNKTNLEEVRHLSTGDPTVSEEIIPGLSFPVSILSISLTNRVLFAMS